MYEIANMPEELREELTAISTSEDSGWLLAQLKDCLAITVRHVIKVAALLRRLDERGVEVDIDFALIPILRKVAYGQVLPELVVTLQGDATLLNRAAALSIPDQRTFARNEPVKVMQSGGSHRMVPPLALTRRELRQVIGRSKLRSDTEQVGWLNDERDKVSAAKGTTDHEITVDRKRGGIVANGVFISSMDMVRFLGDLTN
jgi:hypothetical protein